MGKSLQLNSKASLLFLALIIIFIAKASINSNAASASDFTGANSAINSAYSATLAAQQKGGNVSQLVTQLNSAIAQYQKAERENSTNPSVALSDLQNATRIAGSVVTQAPTVAAAGTASVQSRDVLSISSAVAIGIIAVLIYIFGERIYRRLWYYFYKDYLVVSSKNG
jgi:hypothetical protein